MSVFDGFPPPSLVISKCLGFEPVRFDHKIIQDEFIQKLSEFVTFHPVCPEMEIGLGTPRFPVRLVQGVEGNRMVQPATNKELTLDMTDFSASFLASCSDIDGFVLKSRSPSCGIKEAKVYAENGIPANNASGLFGGAALEKFPSLAIEDEGRLKNFKIREHFLTKIFALARLRELEKNGDPNELVEFHSRYKYLLMTYDQNKLSELGRIVADQRSLGAENAIKKYKDLFGKTLYKTPDRSNIINTFQHIFGYFKKDLESSEKKFFQESLALFDEGRIPVYSLSTLLHSWAIRFDQEYLLHQALFDPFPKELAFLQDSGKTINI